MATRRSLKSKSLGSNPSPRTKLRKKYSNKKIHAAQLGIEFELSFEEYENLLLEANITVDDIGNGSDNYHLARYNDTGPYKVGNCRFITKRENIAERKMSAASMAAALNNMKSAIVKLANCPVAKRNQQEALSRYQERRKIKAQEKRDAMHTSYVGERNSQFGSCWITDGIQNKKIHKRDLDLWIEKGFKAGRIL